MNTALRNSIDWVGYVDWTVRDFHGYTTSRGATYNSYLIRDEKTALIDAVKSPFAGDLIQNIADLCELSSVDYVICNHAEPDHSGGLPMVMDKLPNAVLVCNKKCELALSRHYEIGNWNIQIVTTGDEISLGRRTLHFIETPMVHWPESMFTYVPEEKLLFSMDAFGQHCATSNRFDDEVDLPVVMDEAKIYYANIVMPFSRLVSKAMEQVKSLDIEMIASSHGVIWRSYSSRIIEKYVDWSASRPKARVLIIYDTMWGSTEEMARAILEGASIPGVEVNLIHIRRSNLTRIATEFLDVATVAFGSATLNQDLMPMAAAVTSYIKGLKPLNKAGFAFGSYGWSRSGAEVLDEWFGEMKWEVLHEPIRANYRPTPEVLDECRIAGKILADKALDMTRT